MLSPPTVGLPKGTQAHPLMLSDSCSICGKLIKRDLRHDPTYSVMRHIESAHRAYSPDLKRDDEVTRPQRINSADYKIPAVLCYIASLG